MKVRAGVSTFDDSLYREAELGFADWSVGWEREHWGSNELRHLLVLLGMGELDGAEVLQHEVSVAESGGFSERGIAHHRTLFLSTTHCKRVLNRHDLVVPVGMSYHL